MKKKNLTLTIICLIAIASLLGYVSYAIISMGITEDEYEVFASTSNGLVFTASGGNTFESSLTKGSMDISNQNNVVISTSDDIVITMDSDARKKICCSYDINWVWEQTDVPRNQYTLSTGATNEYVVEGTFTTSYFDSATGNKINISNEQHSFTKQVPNYGATDNILYSSSICNQNLNIFSTSVSQNYTISTKFYNLPVNQDKLRGGVFAGHIEIANISCTKES